MQNNKKSISRVLLVDLGGTNIRTATAIIGSKDVENTKKQNLDSWIHLMREFI